MHSPIRRASTLTALAAAGLLTLTGLTACGSSAAGTTAAPKASAKKPVPSVGDLYTKARESAKAAKSVHLKGQMTESGESMKIDLAGIRGGDTVGTVSMKDGTFEIRRVGSTVYMKSTADYWKKNAGAEAAEMIGNKYLKLPADAAKDMDEFTVGALLDGIFEDESLSTVDKLASKVEETTVNGQPAYLLSERLDPNGAKIYLAADGTAHLLRIVGPKDDPGSMDFSEWDAVTAATAPAASQIAKIPGM